MLSFTRKLSESFVIGKDIVVKVLGKDENGNVRWIIMVGGYIIVINGSCQRNA
jgi:sRNA-binding carbon storage regulator CsrA